MPLAFITGIAGQDGSYLAELLLAKSYEVHGLVLPGFDLKKSWLAALEKSLGSRLFLHVGNTNDLKNFPALVVQLKADEVYHLAGQTHVLESFNDPEGALELNARATVRLLEATRKMSPMPKVFHASSSEIFGHPAQSPQDENTPVRPQNPYACAKAFSQQMLGVYRERFGLFAVNGILFPHESPRRDEKFGTRQICRAAAAIKLGLQNELRLGDLTALRDWTDARDVVRGMWLAMQHDKPEDFVFASGELHSVQDLVKVAFAAVELNWEKFVKRDESYPRPPDTRRIIGNAEKAKSLLGWEPSKRFKQLFQEMVCADFERLK